MEERHRKEIASMAGPDVRFDQPMRLYTTFRAGGNAAIFYRARRLGDLRRVLSYAGAENIPFLVVGKGSNLLVTDQGFDGIAIRLLGEMARVEFRRAAQLLDAGGGATVRMMMKTCIERGQGGVEFLAGIPGTAGGAVVMNAGAHGRQTGDAVESVQWVTPRGELEESPAQELTFSYRKCLLPRGVVVTKVSFRVRPESPDVVLGRMESHLALRRRALPRGFPSAGSVFRNPEGDFAGRLLESAGLKGRRVGGAMISRVHANVIVNTGGATAADILSLMGLARKEVRQHTGIDLETEIRVVGSGEGFLNAVPAAPGPMTSE